MRFMALKVQEKQQLLCMQLQKFKKQVVPGDVLTLKVTLNRHKGPLYFANVTATVDNQIAATGEIMSIIAD